MQHQKEKAFALAGEIVTSAAQAKRILAKAISKDQYWLIPQAESVLRQLRAQEGGAA